jgi:hypothetical protein
MDAANRALVFERLQELEGWAEYIIDALHLDRRHEPVKKAMLEQMVELEALRKIRELSWELRDKLHIVTTQIEFSGAEREAVGAPSR